MYATTFTAAGYIRSLWWARTERRSCNTLNRESSRCDALVNVFSASRMHNLLLLTCPQWPPGEKLVHSTVPAKVCDTTCSSPSRGLVLSAMQTMLSSDLYSIRRLPARPVVPPSQPGPKTAHVVKQQHRRLATASDVDVSGASKPEGRDAKAAHVQSRIRRRAKAWRDPSTPNTGLINVTSRTNTVQAAACVAADFKDTVCNG